MDEEELAELNAIQSAFGPRRVDTKELEIEGHDPLKIQKVLERRRSNKVVMFHQFPVSEVSIKRDKKGPCCSD